MSETIIFFIEGAVIHAERPGEIEHHAARREKLRRQIVAHFMGGSQKNDIDSGAKLADIRHRLQRQIDNPFQLRMQIGN